MRIGPQELIIVLIIVLVIFGPKNLPKLPLRRNPRRLPPPRKPTSNFWMHPRPRLYDTL